jgi:hypothetical protein
MLRNNTAIFVAIASVIITIILSFTSNVYLVGFPVFLYSLMPLGEVFLYIELFLWVLIVVSLLVWARRIKNPYVVQALIFIVFILINMFTGNHTDLNVTTFFSR